MTLGGVSPSKRKFTFPFPSPKLSLLKCKAVGGILDEPLRGPELDGVAP
jgi:hypothetical protein